MDIVFGYDELLDSLGVSFQASTTSADIPSIDVNAFTLTTIFTKHSLEQKAQLDIIRNALSKIDPKLLETREVFKSPLAISILKANSVTGEVIKTVDRQEQFKLEDLNKMIESCDRSIRLTTCALSALEHIIKKQGVGNSISIDEEQDIGFDFALSVMHHVAKVPQPNPENISESNLSKFDSIEPRQHDVRMQIIEKAFTEHGFKIPQL